MLVILQLVSVVLAETVILLAPLLSKVVVEQVVVMVLLRKVLKQSAVLM
jgi:hypothetical protein